MHAVILTPGPHRFGAFDVPSEAFNFVLCHVRWVNSNWDNISMPL